MEASPPPAEPDDTPVPGYRNYSVFCDESGIDGHLYYGFGSLWMPYERRGDFAALIERLREKHGYQREIKWTKVTPHTAPLAMELIDAFFRHNWLMFHCLIVRKGYVDKSHHDGDYDVAMRKHFAMLLQTKIRFFSEKGVGKAYHVYVDPLPSRYKKADEAAQKIVNSTLKRDLGLAPVHKLVTRDSRADSGIQLADLLLGTTMADWNRNSTAAHKVAVREHLALHLGWPDLAGDTRHTVWKFNVWSFYDPTTRADRETRTRTREVNFKVPIPAWRGRC